MAGSTVRSTQTGFVLPATGVGVGVGVDVGGGGVGVGVGVPVSCGGVGVGVGVLSTPIENTSLQFISDAFGVTCGTVGATGVVCSNFVLVRYATTPMPMVIIVTSIRYQYFLRKLILVPRSVGKHFSFDYKISDSIYYSIPPGEFIASILCRGFVPCSAVDSEMGFGGA